jgi:hypothetical protein
MKCPKCAGGDAMTRTETTTKKVLEIGFFWKRTLKDEQTKVTHRCLDCGHKWEE